MKELALTIPGYGPVETPGNIPSGPDAAGNIIQLVINFFFLAVIIAALFFTLYGGILWITSQGDKQKIDKARRTIIFAIMGIIIAALAFGIIQLIGQFTGISVLRTFGDGAGSGTSGIQNSGQCTARGGFCDPGACTAGNPIGSCGQGIVCCSVPIN